MSEPFGEESERRAPGGGPLSWGDTEVKLSPGDPKKPPRPPLPVGPAEEEEEAWELLIFGGGLRGKAPPAAV